MSKKSGHMSMLAHLVAMCVLALVGHHVGTLVADVVFYDLLQLTDPYPGPRARRMLITSGMQATVVSLLMVGYGALFKVKGRFTIFTATILLAGVSVAIAHIRVVGGFSLEDRYWLFSFCPYVAALTVFVAAYYGLTRRFESSAV